MEYTGTWILEGRQLSKLDSSCRTKHILPYYWHDIGACITLSAFVVCYAIVGAAIFVVGCAGPATAVVVVVVAVLVGDAVVAITLVEVWTQKVSTLQNVSKNYEISGKFLALQFQRNKSGLTAVSSTSPP